jgi:electron transfer flavoprotein beta subunit
MSLRVLVCVKRVPAPGAEIVLTDDRKRLDTEFLGFTTSPHEECAVEEAVRIKESSGGTVTVLTLGPEEAEEQLRYAVSVGADQAVLIVNQGDDLDPQATSSAVAAAIRSLEEAEGPFNLILFGNESADSGGYQVGVRVAFALGRPMVNGIKGIEVGEGSITARRATDAGFEVYRLPMPAVLGVKEGINLPRYPTLTGRLASKKVVIERRELTPERGGLELVELSRPVQQKVDTVMLGRGADAAPRVVDTLVELGVL